MPHAVGDMVKVRLPGSLYDGECCMVTLGPSKMAMLTRVGPQMTDDGYLVDFPMTQGAPAGFPGYCLVPATAEESWEALQSRMKWSPE